MAIYKPSSSTSTFDSTFDSTFSGSGSRQRGSIGGSTFQKIGVNYAIRHRVPICNKKTERQTHSRNRFESKQQIWRTLDEPGKESFRDEAINYPRINSLGEVYTMSGINLQNAVNTNAFTNNEPPLTAMPTPQPPPAIEFEFAAMVISTQAMDIITLPIVVPSTHSMLIYVTRPVSPGQLQPNQPFVYLGLIEPNQSTGAVNWFNTYNDIFGVNSNNVGEVFHVALQFISQVTFMSGLTIFATSETIVA